jgi:uncharacterized protein (TIGR00266 family)
MADVIDYKIHGDDMQIVEIELDPSEGVRAEVGAMMFMEEGIQMETGTGGGLFKGLRRMFTGDGFFICTFYNTAAVKRSVSFGAPYPGKVIPIDLKQVGGTFICQKDSFLCAANGIDIDIAFTKKIGAGLFGGEGFILQRLSGDGLAFVRERETLRVDTGCIVAMAPTVDYDIQFVGGFKNALFGGEGLFLASLTGPGIVYLQSLPLSRLADRIVSSSRTNREQSNGIGGIGGGILGGLLGGDNKF